MRIGICSPITISEFLPYFDEGNRKVATGLIGLMAPSVDALVHRFIGLGHDIVIFTLAREVKRSLVLEGRHLKIYVGRYRKTGLFRSMTLFFSEIMILRRFIRNEPRLDIIHAHWTYEFAIAALAAKCPIACTVRDVAEVILALNRDGYRLIRYLMNCYVFARKRRIRFIANSAYTERQLTRYHRGVRFEIIPNPARLEMTGAVVKTKKPSIISITNGWTELKNIDRLIMAFADVRKTLPEAELMLVGNAFKPDVGPQYAKMRGLPIDGIRFIGSIPHDTLADILSSAWLMVHPSLEESFGNTLVEAMACSVPVVGGRDSGSVPWVLGFGKGGVLCDVTDIKDIASNIVRLLNDDKLRNEIGMKGRLWVENNFSIDKVAEQTIEFYKMMLGK